MKVFDIDAYVSQYIRSKTDIVPAPQYNSLQKSRAADNNNNNDHDASTTRTTTSLDSITYTPYVHSFASRLYGSPRASNTLTKDESWLSSWNGRKLRPYIRRDFENKPLRLQLLQQIRFVAGQVSRARSAVSSCLDNEVTSIDYVYFQAEHLEQVNNMLRRCFWEGIDVSESLLFPEFSVVALYKRCVVGCAFMTPEAYITYIAVLPGWDGAGIGQYVYLSQKRRHVVW